MPERTHQAALGSSMAWSLTMVLPVIDTRLQAKKSEMPAFPQLRAVLPEITESSHHSRSSPTSSAPSMRLPVITTRLAPVPQIGPPPPFFT